MKLVKKWIVLDKISKRVKEKSNLDERKWKKVEIGIWSVEEWRRRLVMVFGISSLCFFGWGNI